MFDYRIEAFLKEVLALEGKNLNLIREGVFFHLANCERRFRIAETAKRMKDKAVHACHMLCRARVVEEIQRRKGTVIAEHLKIALSVIDGPAKAHQPFK
jgi:hypothetical protein